jgi:hypothetical protein
VSVRTDIVGNRGDRRGDAGHHYQADRQVASDWSANIFRNMIYGGIGVVLHTPLLKVMYGRQSSAGGTLIWGRKLEGHNCN